eukprot:gnl/Dysnectes_brevis/805_a887_2050.p1 GENE.gnl/Dysnectes_brevis/805_a887_2050~~gnl/Dysnectes_brevis/805_a887_2050.p1  ORF type:complete len:1140 (-),score=479.17 gnl/Dysnectes_brevis/805_a887_2050:134-3238(-)
MADNANISFSVEASYLEIYNEKIRDLLVSGSNPPPLRVREHPELGPFVAGLSKTLVSSFDDIFKLIKIGDQMRTVAATKMNATSSRSHSIFTLAVVKTLVDPSTGAKSNLSSQINLVDLAGSERLDSTGATGQRLKEGCSINSSLSALGLVIETLAKNMSRKSKSVVPYRNSVLTYLLKQSLGGNSQTTMVAALSPADINYSETMSTLRYADRAKKIENKVKKNETPEARYIRSLLEQIESLKARVGTGDGESEPEADEDLRAQLEEYERMLGEQKKTTEERLHDAEERARAMQEELEKLGVGPAGRVDVPHLINLHEDPRLSETLIYRIKDGETKLGSVAKDVDRDGCVDNPDGCEIVFGGVGIMPQHLRMVLGEAASALPECGVDAPEWLLTGTPLIVQLLPEAEGWLNGEAMDDQPVRLFHGDRMLLGTAGWLRYEDPAALVRGSELAEAQGVEWNPPVFDFEYARREFSVVQARAQGLDVGGELNDLISLQSELERLRMELEAARDLLDAEREEVESDRKSLVAERAHMHAKLAKEGESTPEISMMDEGEGEDEDEDDAATVLKDLPPVAPSLTTVSLRQRRLTSTAPQKGQLQEMDYASPVVQQTEPMVRTSELLDSEEEEGDADDTIWSSASGVSKAEKRRLRQEKRKAKRVADRYSVTAEDAAREGEGDEDEDALEGHRRPAPGASAFVLSAPDVTRTMALPPHRRARMQKKHLMQISRRLDAARTSVLGRMEAPKQQRKRKQRDSLQTILPLINESNSIARDLDAPLSFAVESHTTFVPPKGTPQVDLFILAVNHRTGRSQLWDDETFVERVEAMRLLYAASRGEVEAGPSQDPFAGLDLPGITVASCEIPLANLITSGSSFSRWPLTSPAGRAVGELEGGVRLRSGQTTDVWAPGKRVKVVVELRSVRGLPTSVSRRVHLKWRFGCGRAFSSQVFNSSSFDVGQTERIFLDVTPLLLRQMREGVLRVEVLAHPGAFNRDVWEEEESSESSDAMRPVYTPVVTPVHDVVTVEEETASTFCSFCNVF